MAPELLLLALDFYRAPLRYEHLTDPKYRLPAAFDSLFGDLASVLSAQNLDKTANLLDRQPEEIETAARFFIRQVLLIPGGDHYRTLGVSMNADEATLRQHYHLLVRLFHPDRSHEECELDETYTVRINDAYNTLRSQEARQAYDRELEHRGIAPMPPPLDFIRPTAPLLPAGTEDRTARLDTASIKPTLTWWLLGLILLLGGAYLMTVMRKPPLPGPNPDAVLLTPSQPDYLTQDPDAATPAEMLSVEQPPAAAPPPESPPRRPQPPLEQMTAARTPQAFTQADAKGDVRQPVARAQDTTDIEQRIASALEASRAEYQASQQDAREKQPLLPAKSPTVAPSLSAPEPATRPGPARAPAPTPAPEPVPAGRLPTPASRLPPVQPAPRVEPPRHSKQIEKPAPVPNPAILESPPPRRDNFILVNAADSLVRQMARAYQRGDVGSFVGCFTRNAQVNEGRGAGLIRDKYADFFARTAEQRLEIRRITWKPSSSGALKGSADVEIGVREEGASIKWLTGTMDFELKNTSGGLKISRMLHRLKRK